MKRNIRTALLASTLAAGSVVVGLTGASAAQSPVATNSTVTADRGVGGQENYLATKLVLRNTTSDPLWIAPTINGTGKVDDERHVATLLPNQEVTLEGSNTDPNRDVFANCYHAHMEKDPMDKKKFIWVKDKLAVTIWANNEFMRKPWLGAKTETDSDSWYLGVHETEDVELGSDFKAWVHRDADEGDSKVMKMTLNQVPA